MKGAPPRPSRRAARALRPGHPAHLQPPALAGPRPACCKTPVGVLAHRRSVRRSVYMECRVSLAEARSPSQGIGNQQHRVLGADRCAPSEAAGEAPSVHQLPRRRKQKISMQNITQPPVNREQRRPPQATTEVRAERAVASAWGNRLKARHGEKMNVQRRTCKPPGSA
jgi:hypothetical protein